MRLTVLYDSTCTLCTSCRNWLRRQAQWVQLDFVSLHDPSVPRRFPGIERFEPQRQLVAVNERGAVYVGDHAWLMCLWALQEYRDWALRLARPALRPLARAVCQAVSRNRYEISSALTRLFRTPQSDEALARGIGQPVPPPLP